MGLTAYPGALVTFGQATGLDYNDADAPSLFNLGVMLLDPRTEYTYPVGGVNPAYGWLAADRTVAVDQTPTATTSNSVAQAQSFVSGTAITLTASNTTNITVSQSIQAPDGTTVTGLRAIDGVAGTITFGSGAFVKAWDPTTMVSRNITITTTGNDLGATWSIAGRDVYGYKVTETISASSSAATLTSRKTYKYITGITPVTTGTFGSTQVIVGVGDNVGFPLYVGYGSYAAPNYGYVTQTTSNITVGQSLSSVATSTTADVRGVWSSSTAINGTTRLTIQITPSASALAAVITGANPGQGVVGILQYSSV